MTTRISHKILAMLMAALLALAVCAQADEITVYVARDGATVYDLLGRALGTLAADTDLTLTGIRGSVCRVERDGRTAYMYKIDLSRTPTTPAAQEAEPVQEARSVTAYASVDSARVLNTDGSLIAELELNTAVDVTAVKDGICRVTVNGNVGYMLKSELSLEKTDAAAVSDGSTLPHAVGTAVEMDWWDSGIQKIFAKGTVAQITDVESGLSWLERRYGGSSHADSEPLTAADTAALKKAYGGEWSWEQRAVFVTIDGVNYAASIVGMPHDGSDIKDNDFDGHHCIHFTNSRTHGTDEVSAKHQAAIKKAASTTLK